MIALDGSQYFSSEKIHCHSCLTYKGAKGARRYSHQMLQAVMLHPHMRQVLPLAPEPVTNTDGHMERVDIKGRRHIYRWINQIPLNGSRDADLVNFFEYWLQVEQTCTYHNSWVTDLAVAEDNVVELVQSGRARWKIENETFNTLKNQGYHLEHNFGHGQRFLSNNFFAINLLAFYMHQILQLCDLGYQYCRSMFSSRKEFWNNLRIVIKIMLFRNFEHLLRNVADPPEIRAP